jgi:hypothetical protein
LVGCTEERKEKREKKKKGRRGRRERERVRAKGLFVFFLLVNWSYFTMGLLYCGLILEALSFYGKFFWPYLKNIGL